MNYFREQDRAKHKTVQLLLLLALAVICLVVITALTLSAGLYFLGFANAPTFGEHFNNQRESGTLTWIALTVIGLIALHSFFKWQELGSGGDSIAEALGGKRLAPGTQSPEERRLLNVVEEMAIASGNPVPRVYLLKGRSINAFAAGTDRHNAVIGVTEGCMQQLTREQLQGVIAHEFSHIHFGDMLLNHRLVSLLHGILIIGLLGEGIMYAAYDEDRVNSKFNKFYLFGWILVLIGYCGTFFGNLIKAAVSRQREFLADAAAVQFTRNPDGITDALRKIGGSVFGSRIESSHAAEYSHFYFAQGVRDLMTSGLDTHPPLTDRIRRIQPRWDGSYITPKPQPAPSPEVRAPLQPISPLLGGAIAGAGVEAGANIAAINAAAEEAIAAIGNPTPEHMAYAHALIDGLPEPLFNAAHQMSSATCLVYALIIQQQKCNDPLALLATHLSTAELSTIEPLLPATQQLQRRDYLPLIELAMPALKELDTQQYQTFKKALAQLIRADNKVSLFEWCLYRSITANVEEKKVKADKKLSALVPELITLLHALCYANKNDLEQTAAAARALLPFLPDPLPKPTRDSDKLSLAELDRALTQLARLRPLEKPRLLKAVAQCIELDEKVSAEEAELFRVIADSLNCPMPPLLANQPKNPSL